MTTCPAAEWCKYWKNETCQAFASIDYGDGILISPTEYKWRNGECPLQNKPIIMTAEQKKASFAGKRTTLSASYGACGYRYGEKHKKRHSTSGKTKTNCIITYKDKYMAKYSRSYKHANYDSWRFDTFRKNRVRISPWDEEIK